jgi:phage-related protein
MADGSVTIDTKLDNDGFKKGLGSLEGVASKFGAGLKTVFAAGTAAIATTTAGLAALTKAAVTSYASLEQNIGGVETLFKKDAQKVIDNAKKAYKTAGLSANQYMESVTSFSASLLQSVAGDTSKAADIADMAMVDMSDNANKMGTDMSAIQNAYQGFAKQNYTMLDNLKLG